MQTGQTQRESTAALEGPGPDDTAHATVCENCAATLQGDYCHRCGQSAHNPLRHVGHAIEEVFESFWHLDGRIFRTLRELFVPGRVATNYLAGHRVRYIPPLRLFVILSLLTFFVGQLVLHGRDLAFEDGVRMEGVSAEFEAARSVQEVERIRDRLLQPIDDAERAREAPGVNPMLIQARVRIQGQAASRIAELREEAAAAKTATTAPAGAGNDKAASSDAVKPAKVAVSPLARSDGDTPFSCKFNDRPWHPQTNPLNVAWLPDFANRWINKRIGKGCENFTRPGDNKERLFQQFMSAVPTVLFVLMPLFALLLKVLHLGTGRTYLEHLVVALYSHAFLLLMLLSLFVLAAAANAGAPGWIVGLGRAAVWIWMPLYLLLMQKRVYRSGWFSTLIRYFLIGTIYFMLVVFAVLSAAAIGLTS